MISRMPATIARLRNTVLRFIQVQPRGPVLSSSGRANQLGSSSVRRLPAAYRTPQITANRGGDLRGHVTRVPARIPHRLHLPNVRTDVMVPGARCRPSLLTSTTMGDTYEDTIDQVERSQARLDLTLAGLSEEQARGASALPGWSRGHVATHLAR